MSTLSKISVQHIRCHDAYSLDLADTTTVITGKNGSGKTSLLEAVSIALRGSSFRGSDEDIIKTDESWWRIDLQFADKSKRTITYDPSRPNGKKQFVVDGIKNYRLLAKYKYPIVLFEPDDLRLLSGSPSRRRRFIDTMISQIDSGYATTLRKYERALKQRNSFLKQPNVSSDEMFAWDVMLSEYGAEIIEKRSMFTEKINQYLDENYKRIAGDSRGNMTVHYSHTLVGNIKQKLLSGLTSSYERDRLLGYTSIGPHRDDVVFMYGDRLASTVASRGEIRTIVLSLKFIEARVIEESTGDKPIILLDDVYSELDEARQQTLSTGFSDYQIIITSATNTSDAAVVAEL